MSAVHQHSKLNFPGSTIVHDRIHRSPYGSSLEEYIIHKDDLFILYRQGFHRQGIGLFPIISPMRYIQGKAGNTDVLHVAYNVYQSSGKNFSSCLDTD